MHWKERAQALKIEIPAVFLAMKDPATPFAAKFLAAITICYALSPIDLIPDFIPIVGQLDDLLLLPGLAALTIRLIPSDVMEKCRMQSAELWKDGKPKKWYYGLPILLFWGLICIWIIKNAIPA